MLPTIATGNVGSALAGGYEVANSLRFNSGSSDKLTKTFSGNGSTTKFTASFWVKRSKIGVRQEMIAKWSSGSNNLTIRFLDDDKLAFVDYESSTTILGKITNRLFRDVSAWYHIVCNIDTTQSSSDDRAKIFINGLQETSFSSNTVYAQNDSTNWNNTYGNHIGWSGNDGYFDGYMSEVVVVDGQQLDPTSFGEFDEDSGIWKPIDVSGLTFGTNGFYLPYENSGALGQDDSGNGNNFTVNNLTSVDQSTDTCTNNFCTMNPLTTDHHTFSEGNLSIDGSDNNASVGTFGVSNGKWYWEAKVTGSTTLGQYAGITNIENDKDFDSSPNAGTANKRSWAGNGIRHDYTQSGDTTDSGMAESAGTIYGYALDLDNGTMKFYVNGSLIHTDSTIPSDNSTTFFPVSGTTFSGGGGWQGMDFNFGSPPYAISSGNSDGNGYGNFEYSVPSGYYALNTKNLAEYG